MEESCIILTEDLANWLYEEKLEWRKAGYRYLSPSAVSSIEELMSGNMLNKGLQKRKSRYSKRKPKELQPTKFKRRFRGLKLCIISNES